MLAAKKLSRNKLMAYLLILAVLAVAVGGYIIFGNGNETVPGTEAGGSFDISSISAISKTKFDLKGLEKFDIKFLNDQRFMDLSEFYSEVGIKSVIGRNNPFDPYVKASSTAK